MLACVLVCLSVCLPCLSVHLPACLSVYLPACLSVCLSVLHLTVYLFGLVIMITCSICSCQCDNRYVSNWRPVCRILSFSGEGSSSCVIVCMHPLYAHDSAAPAQVEFTYWTNWLFSVTMYVMHNIHIGRLLGKPCAVTMRGVYLIFDCGRNNILLVASRCVA